MKKAIISLLIMIFLFSFVSLPHLIPDHTISAATYYDFISNADKASWSSGAGTLPFPGSTSDSRGFALLRTQITLEDNKTYTKVLETHPQWVDAGWIQGIYPQTTIPTNAKLNASVGFISGATSSDGVIFRVYFQQGQTRQTLIDQRSNYDGHLDSVSVDLSSLAGKTGNFILYVNSVKGSGQDWAVWAIATIEQTIVSQPDLTVTKVFCSADNRITFTLANIGSAPLLAGADGFVDIYVDGTKVTWIKLSTVPTYSTGGGIANPGGTSTYEMATQITKTSSVKVVVDSANNVIESNETNNTREEKVEPCVKLQDIAVSLVKCNYEKKVIEFILKNIGGLKVDKPFDVALYINGVLRETKRVTSVIEPGNIYSSNFSYVLSCTNIKIKVFADSGNEILESDETNNTKEQDCKCETGDTTSPKITKGPNVSQITQTSVLITWETDEESDSRVYYGVKFKKPDLSKEEKKLTKNHSVTLNNLLPATVYIFIVESKDSSGNSVQSKEKLFETLPEEDKEKPTILLILPDRLSGIAKIQANVNDNKGVDRVVFSMDGKAMFTDFSSPYEWNLDTGKIPDGSHSFKATAFDFAGNIAEELKLGSTKNLMPPEESPIKITINEPASWSSVYGYVPIEATINSDIGSCISRAEIWINETLMETYDFYCLPRPIWIPEGGYYSGPSTETISYNWNTIGLAIKNYVIEIKAWDEIGNYGHRSIVVSKIQEPDVTVPLSISRRVTRPGNLNYFEVELNIRNSGLSSPDYTLYNFTVVDKSSGFQPVNEAGLSISRDSTGNNVVSKNLGTLAPGTTKTLSYKLVPILYDPLRSFSLYWIGQRELNVSYNDRFERSYSYNYPSPSYSSSTEVQNAFKEADYLIVTNPSNLYSTYDTTEVDTLLSTAAELAKEKLGVLAYLPAGSSAEHFKNLISVTGSGGSSRWFGYLQDNWVRNGYMLIVGEENIIPSWTIPTTFAPEHNGGDINCSDYTYADTCSGNSLPDIKVGRIVGNDAQTIIKPIRASIDVYKHVPGHNFDRSNALLVSGCEDTWEQFVDEVNRVGDILQTEGTVIEKVHREYFITEVRLLREALVIRGDFQCMGEPGHLDNCTVCLKTHPPMDLVTLRNLISIDNAINVQENRRIGPPSETYDYHFANDGDAWDAGTTSIKSKMYNKDIYFWAGHGGAGPFMEFVDETFGHSHPVVFTDSCWTGKYDGVDGSPEYSFRAGVAVYIGATEVSPSAHSPEFAEYFFRDYWLPGISCGDAFTAFKDWMWRTGDSLWQYRVQEYNLYGDPKYGGG